MSQKRSTGPKAERTYLAPIFALPPLHQTCPLAAEEELGKNWLEKCQRPLVIDSGLPFVLAAKPAEWTTSHGPTSQEIHLQNNCSSNNLFAFTIRCSQDFLGGFSKAPIVQSCCPSLEFVEWQVIDQSSSSFRPQLQLAHAWSWRWSIGSDGAVASS